MLTKLALKSLSAILLRIPCNIRLPVSVSNVGLLCAITLSAFLSLPAAAQQSSREQIFTGADSEMPKQLGRDLVRAAAELKINVILRQTAGILESVERLIGTGSAATAILPSDILFFLDSGEQTAISNGAENLRQLAPLYKKNIHLLARRSISSLEDLNNKRVITGVRGSRSWLTGQNIMRLADVNPTEIVMMDVDSAVRAVLQNDADAMFYVDSEPAKVFADFSKWQPDSQYRKLIDEIHILPLTEQTLLKVYDSSVVKHEHYDWLDKDIQTVSFDELLVAVDLPGDAAGDKNTGGEKPSCNSYSDIATSTRELLSLLRIEGSNAWQQTQQTISNRIYKGWQSHSCAQQQLVGIDTTAVASIVAPSVDAGHDDELLDEELSEEILNGIKQCLTKGICE